MKLGNVRPRFGPKARAQRAAIASRKAGDANKTFTTLRAQTASERQAAIAAISPIGSRWRSTISLADFTVTVIDVHGYVVMSRESGGVYWLWPHVERVSSWERLR
jgi:hypothetical protein